MPGKKAELTRYYKQFMEEVPSGQISEKEFGQLTELMGLKVPRFCANFQSKFFLTNTCKRTRQLLVLFSMHLTGTQMEQLSFQSSSPL